MFNGKKAEGQTLLYLLLGGIAIMLAMQPGGFFNNSSGSTGTTSSGGSSTVTVGGTVNTPATSATLTLKSATDRYAPSTTVSNIFHQVYLNGGYQGYFADGATMTVTSGDTINVITGANSSTATPGFYANQVTFKIGNKGAYTLNSLWDTAGAPLTDVTYVAGDKNALALVGNATPTIVVQDNLGQVQTLGTNTIALGAADPGNKCATITVTSAAKKGFSPFASPEVICNMNKFYMKQIVGEDMSNSPFPVGVSLRQYVPSAPAGEQVVNITPQSFVLNGFVQGADTKFKVCFLTDDTNDPPASGMANVTCNLYDQNLYRNTITGAVQSGYETNAGVDVGTSTVPTFAVAIV